MAGDLEEFLKRAAERRAQKQGGGGGKPPAKPKPKPKPRQEYTDARRERQVRPPVEEAIPVAEVVEHVNPLAEKQRKLAEAKAKAKAAQKKLEAQQKKSKRSVPAREPVESPVVISSGTAAEQLIEMLKQPGGMRQAFLLRELFDRPSDRW